LTRRTARSCERIAKKSALTGKRFVQTEARSGKIAAKPDLTCANIARIDAKERHSKSFGRTVVKSELIDTKYAATGMSDDRIGGICAEMFATSGATDAMPVGISSWGKRGKSKRGKG
jgi:hypothetical protein